MIKEILIEDPITYEEQPDSGRTPMIDPYDGCQLCCPYCFQIGDAKWNRNIYVNMNIADLLRERLATWVKTDELYIGSRCDPYMQMEEKYGLTRKCLSILNDFSINTMIVTKSDNNLIFRDLDILKNFSAELTVLLGISNINQIGKGVQNENILTANKLKENGVTVWIFVTPVLPYAMNVDEIISELNTDIPVFLDKLRINNDTIAKNMTEFIKQNYPMHFNCYERIIYESDEDYYNDLKKTYSNDNRVKFIF